MGSRVTQILGIVNLTRDSFSDAGRFLQPDAAIEHALQLSADGADIIDLGAESTHPDAEDVSAETETERLTPVIRELKRRGLTVSVDTSKPAVMRAVLELGADMINDVAGFTAAGALEALRGSGARLIVMHAIRGNDATGSTAGSAVGRCIYKARAQRAVSDPRTITSRVVEFLRARVNTLEAAGIARSRLILDPGMGFFLGQNAAASLAVLAELRTLRDLGLPLCVSTSRKSFIGSLLSADTGGQVPRPVGQRGAGTLASELWAAAQRVEYIRTHDARALRDALRVWQAIETAGNPTGAAPPRGVTGETTETHS